MKNKVKLIIIILFGVIAIVFILVGLLPRKQQTKEVLLLCGASMRAPLEATISQYKSVSSTPVIPTYGGSGDICAQVLNTGKGDILVMHDPFMEWAEKKGVIEKYDTLAYLDIVLIVPKGNPKGIREFKDLAQPGLRVGIGNQVYSTSGVMVKEMLKKLDYGEAIQKNVVMESKGHQERCVAVSLGNLDVAVVWASVAILYTDKLDIIQIPRELYVDSVTSATYGVSNLKNVKVTIGLTKMGAKNKSAIEFYDFVVKNSKAIFESQGFRMNPL